MRRFRANHAFTLVELLVVIAIISILASLLLPVLGNAIVEAGKTSCAGHQRQFFLTLQIYGQECGRYPTVRAEHTRSPTNSENKGEVADLTDEDDSLLLSYVDTFDILYCSVKHRKNGSTPVPYFLNRTYTHPKCNTVDPVRTPATGNGGWEWHYDKAWGIDYRKPKAGYHQWPIAKVAFIGCDAQRFNMAAFLVNRRSFQPHDRKPDMHIWPWPTEPFRLARNMTAGDGHTKFIACPASPTKHFSHLFVDGM